MIASFSVAQNRPEDRVVKQTRLLNSVNIEQFIAPPLDVCWNLAFAASDPNTILYNSESVFFHACLNKWFHQVTNKTREKFR